MDSKEFLAKRKTGELETESAKFRTQKGTVGKLLHLKRKPQIFRSTCAPNGLRQRRLGESAFETEQISSLESRFFGGAHQPSAARFVRQQVITGPVHRQDKSSGARRIAGKRTWPTASHIMTRERAKQQSQLVTSSMRSNCWTLKLEK